VTIDRREFLTSLVGALAVLPLAQVPQDSLPGTGPAGRVFDPARAGRGVDTVTAGDNDLAIQKLEKQLKCTCGCGLDVYTCRTTDFTCTFSPAMHKRVLALVAAGLSEPQIIADFVKQNGPSVMMVLPKRGFNLAGYFLPGAVGLTAAVLLFLALRRWTATAAPAPAVPAPTGASAGELERLQRALDDFDA
jgi:cytochrome c-type biogenesis protein CcmH/NrfF